MPEVGALDDANDFMWSANLVPGGDGARANLLELVLGQVGHRHIGIDHYGKDDHRHLMIHQIGIAAGIYRLGKHVGVPDLHGPLLNIGQPGQTSTSIDGNGGTWIGRNKFISRPTDQGSHQS